ncbi:MAG: RNA methyltransferase [Terriglobales bacterium]
MSLRIVLVHTRNALNIGAAARAMANFGFRDLVLVQPYAAAWESARSARAGLAVLRSARAVETIPEAVAGCSCVIGTSAAAGRTPALPVEPWPQVAASLPGEATALLFGSERSGLTVEELSHCHRLARIPTRAAAPSMNLGQAVAVCCYELARSASAPAAPALPAAIPAPALERLLAVWNPLLEQLGVVQPAHSSSQTRALRQMLLRWRLNRADETRLLGIARQLRHTLSHRRG